MFFYWAWCQTTACGKGNEGDLNAMTVETIEEHVNRAAEKQAEKKRNG
jgi:hypothetical protein